MSFRGKQRFSPGNSEIKVQFESGQTLLKTANAALAANIRKPNKKMPFRWSACVIGGREMIDINALYPLVQAWCQIDVSTAESLLKSAFYLQDPDGSLASRYFPDGTTPTDEAPWPLLIQAARRVWEAGHNTKFLEAILPRLYRYMDWIYYHFVPLNSDIPVWQSPKEALIPENFEHGSATPDLAILLLCELEALQSLEFESPAVMEESIELRKYISKLQKTIQTFFWNRKKEELRAVDTDTYADLETPQFYSAMAAMSDSISPEIMVQIKPILIREIENIFAPDLWPSSSSFRIDSVLAFILIESARNAGLHQNCRNLYCDLWNMLVENYRHNGTIPNDLSSLAIRQEHFHESDNTETPLPTSALISFLGNRLKQTGQEKSFYHHLMSTLDRHRLATVATPVALLAIAVLSINIFTILKETPTGARLEASLGMANIYYDMGKYEEALQICDQYNGRGYPATARLVKAKILYQLDDYDGAQEIYSELIPEHPWVQLNIALLLYSKGQYEQAIDAYQEFIDNFGQYFPEESKRAELAIELISQHSLPKVDNVDNND